VKTAVYIVVFVFFAIVLAYQGWYLWAGSVAKVKPPRPARILRAVNIVLTLAAMGIVIYELVK